MSRALLILSVFAAITLGAGATSASAADPPRAPTSPAGLASAPAPARYGVQVTRNLSIPLADGTILKADVFRPTDPATGKAATGPFPVVMSQTPYGKAATQTGDERVGQITGYNPYLVKRGYVFVVVDVRGSGASGGGFQLLGPQEARDSVETIRWASRLPGTTGEVGTLGPSYLGIDQLLAAAEVGPGSPLKAIFPIVAANDPYRDLAVSGGLLNVESVAALGGAITSLHLAGPAYGNPGDPLAVATTTGQHTATVGDFLLPDAVDLLAGGPRGYDGDYWRARSPDRILEKIAANGIPAYLVGGLYDVFQSGPPLNFSSLQNAFAGKPVNGPMSPTQAVTGRYQLLMGPWYHVTVPQALMNPIQLAWFDHWLKDVDNGIDRTATPLHLIDPDQSLRHASRYPLEQAKGQTYYLGPGTLTEAPPTAGAGADTLTYNPVSQPCTRATEQWALGVGALALGALGIGDPCADKVVLPTDGLGGLSYTGPPLTADTELAGPITVTLHATSTTVNSAFVATLEAVAPDGTASQITAGALLGSLREVDAARSWRTASGRPSFTYHPYTETSERPVVPGEVTRYDIDVRPTFTRIPKGDRLRLVLTTGDSPHLVPTLRHAPQLLGGRYAIQRSAAFPSALELSVAPVASLATENLPPVACASRRRFRIRLGPVGGRLTGAVVTVAGKRVPVRRATRKGARATAVVDLRGRSRRVTTVRITGRVGGRRYVQVRRYRPCTAGAKRTG